jgi:pimeloyl-ACP methyl ester carboxylesterase
MALPVVFVHGVPEDAKLWDGVREHIIDRETFALNLPGFGTPVPSDFSATKEAYLAWLVEQLEGFPKPFDLVGHDWGGILVDRVVFTHSDLMHTFASDTIGISSGNYEWHDLAKVWQTPGAGEAFMQANAARPIAERVAGLVAAGMTPEYAGHVAHPDPVRDDCILKLYRSAPNVSSATYTTGTNTSVSNSELARPPITTVPSDDSACAPGSSTSASGIMPAIMADVVIMIGRKRSRPLRASLRRGSCPRACARSAKSTSRDAVLADESDQAARRRSARRD